MTVETQRPDTAVNFQWFGDGGHDDTQSFMLPNHEGRYTPTEVEGILYGLGRVVQTHPLEESHAREVHAFTGAPYTGPMFIQRNDSTCVAWAITHGTFAVDAKPDIIVTTNLLNAALPTETKSEGLHLTTAADIADQPHSEVALTLDPPLKGIIGDLGPGSTVFMSPEAHMKRLIKTRVGKGKALVVVASEVPNTTNPQDNHAVCITAFRQNADRSMDVQVIDSLTGSRFEPVASITEKVLTAGHPIMTITKKTAAVPQPRY